MPQNEVRYLVFDIESVALPDLVASIHYPNEDITPAEALRRYRDELLEKKGSDFVPYTFQVPVSLALAKLSADYSLLDLKVLGGDPESICNGFWRGWRYYDKPILVTFNGRGFDIPLLELTAFRYGLPIADWIGWGGRNYEQPRNRFNLRYHIDLCDFWTNSGAVSFSGGLNIAAKIINKPGKMDTHGDMVQDMIDAGKFNEVHQYCRCDVLDTYFVFLRTMLLSGKISQNQEKNLIEKTKSWLQTNATDEPIYQTYLDAWERSDPYFPKQQANGIIPESSTANENRKITPEYNVSAAEFFTPPAENETERFSVENSDLSSDSGNTEDTPKDFDSQESVNNTNENAFDEMQSDSPAI